MFEDPVCDSPKFAKDEPVVAFGALGAPSALIVLVDAVDVSSLPRRLPPNEPKSREKSDSDAPKLRSNFGAIGEMGDVSANDLKVVVFSWDSLSSDRLVSSTK